MFEIFDGSDALIFARSVTNENNKNWKQTLINAVCCCAHVRIEMTKFQKTSEICTFHFRIRTFLICHHFPVSYPYINVFFHFHNFHTSNSSPQRNIHNHTFFNFHYFHILHSSSLIHTLFRECISALQVSEKSSMIHSTHSISRESIY